MFYSVAFAVSDHTFSSAFDQIMSTEKQEIFEYESGFLSSIGERSYLNGDYADFHFVFGTERLPAHKSHLVASDVFGHWFQGDWKDKNETTIGHASIDAFKEFLQFFYLRRVKLTRENVEDVLNLGHMYNVTECVNACETFMINAMTDANVCRAYKWALQIGRVSPQDLKRLKKYCEAVISMNAKSILKSDGFLQCDEETLHEILKMETLRCTEGELFEAYLAWVKSKSSIQQDRLTKNELMTFRDLINNIRFGAMSPQEFDAIVSAHDIFDVDEYKEIIHILASKKYEPKIFSKNRKRRSDMISWSGERPLKCARKISKTTEPYFIKEVEKTVFSTNQPILLKELYCEDLSLNVDDPFEDYDGEPFGYLAANVPSEVAIIEISKSHSSSEGVILYNAEVELLTREETVIIIPNPILIRPAFTYMIRMKQSPPPNCCASYSLKSRMIPRSDTMIKFHNDPIEGGARKGLIIGMKTIPL